MPKIAFLWLIEADPIEGEMDVYDIKYASDTISDSLQSFCPIDVKLTSFTRASKEKLIELHDKLKESQDELSEYIEGLQ